jgi:hypothetical protein
VRSRSYPLGFVAVALLIACDGTVSMVRPSNAVIFRSDTTATGYFGTLYSWADTVFLESHAEGLRAFGEPPLRGATLDRETFVLRFFWRRSFHAGVAVRVTRSAIGCTLVTTIQQNDMYRLPVSDTPSQALVRGTRLRRDSTALAVQTCDDLAARLDTIGLKAGGPFVEGGGLDGADWIFERLDVRGHAALVRWSPDCSTSCGVFTAGMAFLRAAHALPNEPRELY